MEMEKAYFLKGKYCRVSMRQYRNNMKELFEGFEHYNIPLNIEKYTASEKDAHLGNEAIDKLMRELAQIISGKEYFLGKWCNPEIEMSGFTEIEMSYSK
jgi:hypothetical protein